MILDFESIPKFVVNLDRRPDRLEHITNELNYIGWKWERFSGIDLNSYMGITKSTLSIIDIAKERKYPRVMIIEDDSCFMPYSKSLLNELERNYTNLDFGIFNLSPTLNRPVKRYKDSELLLDLTTLPPTSPDARGIYAANMIIYDESIYDKMFEIVLTAFTNSENYFFALDDFTFQHVMCCYQSYSPIIPIAPQMHGISDISDGYYNNWYLQTYNWNAHSEIKIPNEFMDWGVVQEMKKNKEHKQFYYVS